MNNKPLVSIVVRTKDRPKLLENALESIAVQTYRPIEVVLVNDGGCDLPINKLQKILKDISLCYIKLEENKGRAVAGNIGISNAKGNYIGFLDDDDEYLPEHIMTTVTTLLEKKNEVVYTDAKKVVKKYNKESNKLEEYDLGVFSSYDFSFLDLIIENYIPLNTLLFRKEILLSLNGFDEDFELYEDWDLLLRVAEKYTLFHIPKPTVKYVFWSEREQISQNESLRNRYFSLIYKKHKDKFDMDLVVHLKKKIDVLHKELHQGIKLYKKIETEYKSYIEDSKKEIQRLKNNLKEQVDINKIRENRIKFLEEKVEILEKEINLMVNTLGWKVLTKFRRAMNKVAPEGSLRRKAYERIVMLLKYKLFNSLPKVVQFIDGRDYLRWISLNEPNEEELKHQEFESLKFKYRPKISIVVPVYNTDKNMLCAMLDSVLSQTYDNWELCIVDGNSEFQYIREILEKYSRKDNRIKVDFLDKNYKIAGNSNKALEMAEGEFIAFVDHDDELAPFALYEIVKVLNETPDVDIIYSDEDKINPNGQRCDPFFKPDWSPDLLLCVNYLCHLLVIRKSIIDKVGGFRDGFEGAQDYDLVLRCISETEKIFHIPKILYHWRMHESSTAKNIYSKKYAHESGKKALKEYIQRNGIDAVVLDGAGITNYRVRYNIRRNPKVSVIIPFKDKYSLLKKCVESITSKSSYRNYELILVSNNSEEDKTFEYLSNLSKLSYVKVIEYNKPFNYSKINNYAVEHSTGEVLLFLNNDIEVITKDWIESMLEYALRKDVGAVGCKLLYPDNRIQHAGVVIGMTGFAGHVFSGLPDGTYNYFGSVDFVRNFLAVTGACMMVRRDVFYSVGKFDERFTICGSDVELCLRLINNGYRIIYTPFAKLYHYEAMTRNNNIPQEDFRLSFSVYEKYLREGDPYYNPNLTLLKTDCSLKSEKEEGILAEIITNALGHV